MKRLPFFLILLIIFLSPGLTLGYGDGTCVEGNCMNGQGKLTYSSGTQYLGEFKEGEKHGRGVEGTSGGKGKTGHWMYDMYVGKEKPGEVKKK